MSRKAVIIKCTKEEKLQLEKWANGSKFEKRLNERAKITFLSLEKKSNLDIAEKLQISRFTVGK